MPSRPFRFPGVLNSKELLVAEAVHARAWASLDHDDRLDPELEARFPAETLSRVTIRAGGQSFISPVTAPRGEASDPPSWADLEAKLEQACRFVATPEQRRQLLAALRRLRAGEHAPLLDTLGTMRLSPA